MNHTRRSTSVTAGCLLALCTLGVALAQMPRQSAPDDAKVYFVSPQDGEEVSSPVRVRFGLSGMGVAPAGVQMPETGHHHLLINVGEDDMPPMDMPLPDDERHRHFGTGLTEAVLELEPGTHTLQLVLGDHLHIPHDPPVVSERITVTVTD